MKFRHVMLVVEGFRTWTLYPDHYQYEWSGFSSKVKDLGPVSISRMAGPPSTSATTQAKSHAAHLLFFRHHLMLVRGNSEQTVHLLPVNNEPTQEL